MRVESKPTFDESTFPTFPALFSSPQLGGTAKVEGGGGGENG